MSMLSSQVDELRTFANELDERERHMDEYVQAMREAADTIDALRKQIAMCQIAELKADYDTSRYFELFGTPERAARTYLDYFLNGCDGATCGDGCPFFDTSMYMNCALGTDDYDALLEWLKQEVDE